MTSPTPALSAPAKSMDDIVALCKRRGFIFPASEIYGGINGFWDFGPLGVELKNNLRDAWWRDMVVAPPIGPEGEPLSIVGVDTAIIQNPRVWEASGHVGGFNDPMVDCRQTKERYRADHLVVVLARFRRPDDDAVVSGESWYAYVQGDDESIGRARKKAEKEVAKKRGRLEDLVDEPLVHFLRHTPDGLRQVVGPHADAPGTLTEPRQFNLMFDTFVGAVRDETAKAYLRPETAQGIFLNYKNVLDTMRVKIPFGIAQIGKAFRNEVTPRNFIFRSREFEQMEMEWFCHADEAPKWFEFWCDQRKSWWRGVGLADESLNLRKHDADELAHYAKTGCGTFDIEYRFPFAHPGFGELEGVAHRSNFDLSRHQEHSGAKLEYFDQDRSERYLPHVIEPAAGLSRGVLALICEAFTPDPARPSGVFMKFHPRVAPIKAAVFPLVAKDGMPEIATRLYRDLRDRFAVQLEAGTPFCFTIDGDTLVDQTVTVRHRDTLAQERIAIDRVPAYLTERIVGRS
jgi:glycyl-tRNA synthetase